jgi:hypothetical protein
MKKSARIAHLAWKILLISPHCDIDRPLTERYENAHQYASVSANYHTPDLIITTLLPTVIPALICSILRVPFEQITSQ